MIATSIVSYVVRSNTSRSAPYTGLCRTNDEVALRADRSLVAGGDGGWEYGIADTPCVCQDTNEYGVAGRLATIALE